MVRLKRFQTLLKEKREKFSGESDRVAIAEAGTQFSKNVQIKVDEQFSKENKTGDIKFDKVSSAVKNIPEQLRGDIENLEDGSYNDLVRFIRKYERLLNEVQGGRLYDKKEQEYIKKTVEPVLLEITNLKGPIARAAFAFEDFKSQFKPLKLADRFLGDLPIVGDMIRERLQAKGEADRLAKSTGLRAAKERTRGELKEAAETRKGISKPESSSSFSDDTSLGSVGDELGDLAKNVGTGKVSEESQKEQANKDQKQTNLFELIAENTLESKYLLEELLEAYKDENEGMGELLDTGKNVAMGAGGAAAGAGGLFGLNKLRQKFFGKGKGADVAGKAASKGGGKALGKTALKSVIKKIPILGLGAGLLFGAQRLMAGDVTGAGMEVASGAASLVPGAGTAASVAIDAASAARDMKNAEREVDDTVAQATTEAISDTKGQSVGLGQVYQINADQVMLKANSMKQLQNENDIAKSYMTKGMGNMQNNTVLNQVTNTAKSTFMGPRLSSSNPRNITKSPY